MAKKSETKTEEKATKTTKTRKTYKSKAPLNENQAKKKRVVEKKQEIAQQLEARGMVAELYQSNLPIFIDKRREEFEEIAKLYADEYNKQIAMGNNKLPQDDLEYLISKPLITISGAVRKYSPADLLMFNECYWECVRKANKAMSPSVYVPTLEQLSGLMSMPKSAFSTMYNSSDAEMANAAEIVKDRFVNYYTVNGMTNRINSILVIFTLKAGYGLRDNEAPQVIINNNTTTAEQSVIESLESKYEAMNIIYPDEV